MVLAVIAIARLPVRTTGGNRFSRWFGGRVAPLFGQNNLAISILAHLLTIPRPNYARVVAARSRFRLAAQ